MADAMSPEFDGLWDALAADVAASLDLAWGVCDTRRSDWLFRTADFSITIYDDFLAGSMLLCAAGTVTVVDPARGRRRRRIPGRREPAAGHRLRRARLGMARVLPARSLRRAARTRAR